MWITRFLSIIIIGILIIFGFSSVVFADDFTSTNFILRDPLFGIFGSEHATSTSFQQTDIGGQIAPGEATSTNFIVQAGEEYYDPYTPRSLGWRWYDDEGNETPTSALADENVAPTDIANGNLIKLRFGIDNLSGAAGENIKFKIQFSEYSDFSQDVFDVVEVGDCAGNSLWCYGDGIDSDNDALTTLVLATTTALGTHNESGTTTTTFDPVGTDVTEFEFTLKNDGARANTTYFFRAMNASSSEAVALGNGASYPSVSTEGATLSFTISGLATSTVTEGITTDVATTPTGVPFGILPFNTELEAAQRLTVSTNATEGYSMYVFQRQGLISSIGVEIDPVTGTNPSPTAWGVGCVDSANGCYGYHAGDDTLSGGSTRFSPDDSYAQFDATAREVAFSAIPVTSESIDIVYKTQVTDRQAAGQYESGVVYIIVPTF